MGFDMATIRLDGARASIVLEGDLDAARVANLRSQFGVVQEDGAAEVIVDFRNVRYMCSAGLGLLVEMHNAATRDGGAFSVVNLNADVEKLLSDTKLLEILRGKHPGESQRISALDAVQQHMGREILLLSYLGNITSSLLEAEVAEDIYGLALEGVLQSLKSHQGLLLILVESGDARSFRVAASRGIAPEIAKRIEDTPLRESNLEHHCLAERRAITVAREEADGAAAHPSFLRALTGIDEGVLAPVIGKKSRPLGLLYVAKGNGEDGYFAHSAPVLQVFSNMCGLALEKQSLLEDIQYKNAQLSQTLGDLNKTQDALMESGQLAAVGALVRGLGHALNNKMVPILGYTQMLWVQMQDNPDTARKISVIESSVQDIKRIIEKLRTVSRGDTINIAPHDLREIIDNAIFMLDFLFREHNIRIERHYPPTDCQAPVDRERMTQAFLALFHRLPDVFPPDQRDRLLSIEIQRKERYLEIDLVDNGRAIPKGEMDNLFDPFHEETGAFETGRFNFSIANTILKDHKGVLTVDSGDGPGVRICMEILLERKPR
jgi:anti-anti-sigma factor